MHSSLRSDDAPCQRIRVLVVDDYTAVRRAMAIFVTALDDMELVGEAASGEEALRLCACVHPDVVLLAITMPGMTGAETTRTIQERWPPIRVVGMSSFQEEEHVPEVLRAGAVDCLLKNVSADELARTIRQACAA